MRCYIKKIRFLLAVMASISFFIGHSAYGNTCNPGAALSKAKWATFGKVKKVIIVEPFVNQSKGGQNGWLSMGLSELLGSYLKSAKGIGTVNGLIKRYPPTPINPNYIISGSYSFDLSELKVFLKIYRPTEPPIYQTAFFVYAPTMGRLFTEMAKAAEGIFDGIKEGYDKKAFRQATEETANFMAFEAYIKGLEAMWSFDPNYLDVANVWFEEAKRQDIYFQGPYLAQEDMLGYIAIMTKAEGKPYAQFFQKLMTAETNRQKFIERPSPIPMQKPKIIRGADKTGVTNRFIIGNTHFVAGEAAATNGDLKKAKAELEIATSMVPEDTVALRQLYSVYNQLGETKKAEKILYRISRDGICN